MDTLDWALIRSLLAVAEAGSLSAAARATGLSQPTLGRHVAEAEASLGLSLFTRAPRGLLPTPEMEALLPAARAMAEAAAVLALAAAGRDARPAGTVRLTASRIVSAHLLPPVLAALRTAEPGIEIELVPSDTLENLLHREADIALRMVRPSQPDVIARHLCDLPMGLYAAKTLVAQHGAPPDREALLAWPFVGFDRDDTVIRVMAANGVLRRRSDFAVRCDDQLVYWQLVRAGLGVGGMQRAIGDADPLLLRIAPFIALPDLPLWLAAAPGLRQTPRIARVWDFLAAAFAVPPALDPWGARG